MAKTPSRALRTLADNLTRLMGQSVHDSQAKLAKVAHVDQRTISRILNKEHEPGLDKVEKIAKVFHLDAWQLLVPNVQPGHAPVLAQEESTA